MSDHSVVHRFPHGILSSEGIALRNMLTLIADDFVPSLTQRKSNMDTDFASDETYGIENYALTLESQNNILINDARGLLAFLSFGTVDHSVFPEYANSAYVSTIGVHPDHRNKKLARVLYHHLFNHLGDSVGVLIRTWSSNAGHLHLLKSLNFNEVLRLPDDRGPSVDTVYLYRSPTV